MTDTKIYSKDEYAVFFTVEIDGNNNTRRFVTLKEWDNALNTFITIDEVEYTDDASQAEAYECCIEQLEELCEGFDRYAD